MNRKKNKQKQNTKINKSFQALLNKIEFANIKNSIKINHKIDFKNYFIKSFFFLFFLILLLIIFIYFKYSNIIFYQSNKIDIINNNKEFLLFKTAIKIIFENRMNQLKRSSINYPLPNEIKFKPVMSIKELKAFSYFMKPENIYFEFGSGGSTNLAAYYKLNKIYSVESDVNWHNKLKEMNLNVNFLTIDLKSKGNYGKPGGNNVEEWKKYIQAYKPEYNADIILIDGRFRVACGLDIFSKIRNNTLVLIHDYENRNYYHILENYYIKIKNWGNLSAFFKNPKITDIPKEVYDKYIYIYD